MDHPGLLSYSVIISLSLLVIMSYLFDILARRSRIPSVLLLLTVGIILRLVGSHLNIAFLNSRMYLELFGIIGVILIVLEATLELSLTRAKLPVIKKSLASAVLVFLASSLLIALVIKLVLNAPFQSCFVNAVPLAVISSAIVIPSVCNLGTDKKEFMVYEATFSDIIGIMIFNFAIQKSLWSASSLFSFAGNLTVISLISAVCSLLLLLFIDKIAGHNKFFLLLSILFLVYSLGELFRLSSLLLILVFGLTLSNVNLIVRGPIKRYLNPYKLNYELRQLKLITSESAFVIRTFFFVLFGYSIHLAYLLNREIILLGSLIMVMIFTVRYFHLKYIARVSLFPELFIAPRGLITIILYYSIPQQFVLKRFGEGVLFFVILVSSLIMMAGLMHSGSQGTEETVCLNASDNDKRPSPQSEGN
jgi:NhaP-type Na+/H+ or K+/H+ antiporter